MDGWSQQDQVYGGSPTNLYGDGVISPGSVQLRLPTNAQYRDTLVSSIDPSNFLSPDTQPEPRLIPQPERRLIPQPEPRLIPQPERRPIPQSGQVQQQRQQPQTTAVSSVDRLGPGSAITIKRDGVTENFFVVDLLGKGHTASVVSLCARPGDVPTYVAKVFDKKDTESDILFLKKVLREYSILLSIDERFGRDNNQVVPLPVSIGDVGEANADGNYSSHVLVFPFFKGVNLYQFLIKLDAIRWVDGRHGIWVKQMLRLASIICQKFKTLLDLQIYHRDIKLENIIVEDIDPFCQAIESRHVRVIDFGNACVSEIFARKLDARWQFTSCSTPDLFPLAYYAPSRLYADPRTFALAGQVPAAPALLETAPVHGSPNGPVERNAAVFSSQLIPRLWPGFEAYSVAVCIQFILDPDQRQSLYQTLTNDVNSFKVVEFAMPKVKGGKLIFGKLAGAFIDVMQNITNEKVEERNLASAEIDFMALSNKVNTYETYQRDFIKSEAEVVRRLTEINRADNARLQNAVFPSLFEPGPAARARAQSYVNGRKRSVNQISDATPSAPAGEGRQVVNNNDDDDDDDDNN